jgi:periplasmic protein TonB
MSTKAPVPPVQIQPAAKVRSFLGWAFIISIVAHFVFGGLMPYKPYITSEKETEKVSVTKKTKVIVPTPPPTPTPPPPTPPPKQTPPPVTSTVPPQQPKLKLDVPKTTSKGDSSRSSEHTYVQPKEGSQQGVPQGTVASAPPAPTSGPATAAPPPPPTPPRCAQPHKDATTTRPVEPDYPDLARQQGAVGTVQVKVSLTPTGSVVSTSVYKSSGNALLDKAALAAARASSYAPEVEDCSPVAGTYLFRADFSSQ